MGERTVLVVGLDPDRVDFSGEGYGGAARKGGAMVKQALAEGRSTLERHGYLVDLCMVLPDETASAEIRRWLGRRRYDYIVFGAGLRLNRVNTELFTRLIGIVHVQARDATLCFNAGAQDTADCVLRVAEAGNADVAR